MAALKNRKHLTIGKKNYRVLANDIVQVATPNGSCTSWVRVPDTHVATLQRVRSQAA